MKQGPTPLAERHRELAPSQRLALAVLGRAIADVRLGLRPDWFRSPACRVWCEQAGVDVRHFRWYVLDFSRRSTYAGWLHELLDECPRSLRAPRVAHVEPIKEIQAALHLAVPGGAGATGRPAMALIRPGRGKRLAAAGAQRPR